MSDQDAIAQAYARLTVHEYALEIILANWLAGMREDAAEAFFVDFRNRCRSSWGTAGAASGDEFVHKLLRDSIEISDDFADKVHKTMTEIRQAMARETPR